MTAAARKQRQRDRERNGIGVYRVEVADEIALQNLLIAGGYLSPATTDQKCAVESALCRYLENEAARHA